MAHAKRMAGYYWVIPVWDSKTAKPEVYNYVTCGPNGIPKKTSRWYSHGTGFGEKDVRVISERIEPPT